MTVQNWAVQSENKAYIAQNKTRENRALLGLTDNLHFLWTSSSNFFKKHNILEASSVSFFR